jgi:hypothetical protein
MIASDVQNIHIELLIKTRNMKVSIGLSGCVTGVIVGYSKGIGNITWPTWGHS